MKTICKLKGIYKALYNLEKEFSDSNGITINEIMILCCLKDGKQRSANELYDFVGLSNSRVSRVINTVEKKGYITRKMGVNDKRQMFFKLTPTGKEKVEQMLKNKICIDELTSQFASLVR